jgi:hypothetical protein
MANAGTTTSNGAQTELRDAVIAALTKYLIDHWPTPEQLGEGRQKSAIVIVVVVYALDAMLDALAQKGLLEKDQGAP